MSRKLVIGLIIGVLALVPPALEQLGYGAVADAVREIVAGAGLCKEPSL
jgi:hypothetical protein